MDSTERLERLLLSIECGDRREAIEHLEELLHQLKNGGSMPDLRGEG